MSLKDRHSKQISAVMKPKTPNQPIQQTGQQQNQISLAQGLSRLGSQMDQIKNTFIEMITSLDAQAKTLIDENKKLKDEIETLKKESPKK